MMVKSLNKFYGAVFIYGEALQAWQGAQTPSQMTVRIKPNRREEKREMHDTRVPREVEEDHKDASDDESQL